MHEGVKPDPRLETPAEREAIRRAEERMESEGGRVVRIQNQIPSNELKEGVFMQTWSLIFFILAIVAAIIGFTGIAMIMAPIAKLFFLLFLILFVISLIVPRFHHRPPPV
jgi:uncharacterized membrane protein YtjA (UPF0391 family)